MTSENELASVLRLVGERSNAKIRTALPGRVLSFDPDTQRATCQVSVQSFFFDVDEDEPSAYQPPPVANCPVHYPAGGGFSMRFPLTAGDDCLVLVAERSIDEWMATGNSSVIPRDLRRFDLTDAIVVPGLRPAARPHADFNPDDLEIVHENGSQLRLTNDGKVYLGSDAIDLVTQVDDLASEVSTFHAAVLAFAGELSAAVDPIVVGAGATLATALTPLTASIAALRARIALIQE